MDPSALAERFPEYFDAILIDAPCSGEGMFRKDKEVIRSWEEHGNDFYVAIQKNVTAACLKMLKPGGLLVYSTCTLLPAENSGVVGAFLKDDGRFAAEPFESCGFSAPDGMLTLTPDGGTDGFFIAKLRKLRA
jgi:16S rRNA C967 or C1407 C5-methylase (RsmB/RsmF family)